jgi:nitroreductase
MLTSFEKAGYRQVVQVIISDTNILLKLIFFPDMDLNRVTCLKYGKLTWHPLVAKELTDWLELNKRRGRHKKIEKFSLEVVERALEIALQNPSPKAKINHTHKSLSFIQYNSLANNIDSNSADPHVNDLEILYDSVETKSSLVTNDDLIRKIGCHFLGDNSFNLKSLLSVLLDENLISQEQIKEFKETLAHYGEQV